MEDCKQRYIIKSDPFLSKGDKGDPGADGAGASITLPLSTDDVDYRGNVLTDIIDNLLYLPLTISSFTAVVSTYEKGQVLTSLQFNWSFNKPVDAQSITGTDVVPPTLLISDRTKIVALTNISTNRVITLTADDVSSDANLAKTATLTLSFLNRIYYGKAAIGTINSAFILALTGELKSNRTKSYTLSTGAGEYIWFASPVAYGLPSFKTNGFNGGFDLISTLSFTNASGHTENYYVFRTTNDNLGVTAVDVL